MQEAVQPVYGASEASATSGVYTAPRVAGGGWGIVAVTTRSDLAPVQLTEGVVVGCAADADVMVAGQGIEPRHARFTVRTDGVYVQAIDDRSGIWVDGVRAACMALTHGAVVRMGQMVGIFVERDLSRHVGPIHQIGEVVHGPRQRQWVDLAIGHVRAGESFVIEGGPGIGKRALARAAASAGGSTDAPVQVDCRSPEAKAAVCDGLGLKPAVFIALHLEQLERSAQNEAVRLLKRAPGTVLIATLGRSLEQALAEGLLAPAVAAAVGGRRVVVPPLDERREDIASIVHALCERESVSPKILAAPLLEQFMRGGWPGGVRELRRLLMEASANHLLEEERIAAVRAGAARPAAHELLGLQQADPDLARARMLRALERAGGTIAAAARELRVSRQAFYREVKRLNVALPGKKSRESTAASA